MRAWLWHLVNDPVRDNPWSFCALALSVGALLWSLWITDGWRRLPRRRVGRERRR